MNRRLWYAFLALAMCGALVADSVAGPISVGNLVVVRAGTGQGALSGSATAAFLDEYDAVTPSQAVPVQTIALPTVVSGSNRRLTLNGTATSEGYLKQSSNGLYLTLGGYDKDLGGTNPANDSAATTNRVIGLVDIATGSVDTTTALTNAYNGSNIRSAVTTDGIDMWAGGNAGTGEGNSAGVQYFAYGDSTSTRVNSIGSNRRNVGIFNGRLYVSAQSGVAQSISTMESALPMTLETETVLPGMPQSGTNDNNDFWFSDADTLYMASASNAANNGGIQKWTFDGSNWSLAYTLLNSGAATTAVRGLTGMIDGNGNAVLFATTTQTSNNNLITITDLGAGGGTATILASAGTNKVFRGLEYIDAPPIIIPEPASVALVGLATLVVAGWRRRR